MKYEEIFMYNYEEKIRADERNQVLNEIKRILRKSPFCDEKIKFIEMYLEEQLKGLEMTSEKTKELLKDNSNDTKSPCSDCKSGYAFCCGCPEYFEWRKKRCIN